MVSPEKLASKLYGGKSKDWKVIDGNEGFVCDVCEQETAACLSLCPDCLEKERKQGALEVQSKELVFLNKLQERLNGYHCGYHEQLNKMINNRKKELEGCEKE